MVTVSLTIVILSLAVACDIGRTISFVGVDSFEEMELLLFNDCSLFEEEFCGKNYQVVSVTKGKSSYFLPFEYSKGDNIWEEFAEENVFRLDSVWFISSDSTMSLKFINPSIDDSANYNFQTEAHFWNLENWYQDGKHGDIYYEIREEDFDKYGVVL